MYSLLHEKKIFDSTFKKTRDQKSSPCLSIIVRIASPCHTRLNDQRIKLSNGLNRGSDINLSTLE